MKLGTMDFPLWISLLLLVFIIFPLKSESPEDPNFEDESDNDSTTKSPEDPNDDDKEDETANDSTTKSPEDPNEDDNENETANDSTTKSHEDLNEDDNENETANDSTTKSHEDLNGDDNEGESDNGSMTNSPASVTAVNKTDPATGNSTNGVVVMSTITTVQARPDGMEMAQSGQDGVKDGQRETDIAVKVGVPVALLGLVSLVGIIRLVSSGQLKNRVPGLGRIFGKIPEKSVSVYSANGPSSGKGTSETFVNRTYAMQSGYDNKQPEGKPPAGSDHDNMEQGIYLYDNPEVLSDDSDTMYQTLDDGRLDPSYTDLARSNRQPPAMPQRKHGETAYENTFV